MSEASTTPVIADHLDEAARRSAAILERCRAEQAALDPVAPSAAAEDPWARRPFPGRVRRWTLVAAGLGAAIGAALPGVGVSPSLSATWALVLAVVLGCLAPLFVAAGEDGRRARARAPGPGHAPPARRESLPSRPTETLGPEAKRSRSSVSPEATRAGGVGEATAPARTRSD